MIPEWLLISDFVFTCILIAGVFIYVTWAVVLVAYYYTAEGLPGHIVMAVSLLVLAGHHSVLVLGGFDGGLSAIETTILARLALTSLIAASFVGFFDHLRRRQKATNE